MTGRNEPCPCNSGKKYKRCHGKSATKGGKFAAKPQKDAPVITNPRYFMGAIQREIWKEMYLSDDELVRREAIRKQQFR